MLSVEKVWWSSFAQRQKHRNSTLVWSDEVRSVKPRYCLVPVLVWSLLFFLSNSFCKKVFNPTATKMTVILLEFPNGQSTTSSPVYLDRNISFYILGSVCSICKKSKCMHFWPWVKCSPVVNSRMDTHLMLVSVDVKTQDCAVLSSVNLSVAFLWYFYKDCILTFVNVVCLLRHNCFWLVQFLE